MPTSAATDRPYRILSFDGGGVHAVSYLPVIHHLENHLQQQVAASGQFDMVVGTSTGAIVAMALKLGCPAEDILDLYRQHARHIFRASWLSWSLSWMFYLYHSKHLRAILARFIREKTEISHDLTWEEMSRASPYPDLELVVTLWDVRKRQRSFLSTHPDRHPQAQAAELWQASVADIITACCSAPYYFPARRFTLSSGETAVYCDGGLTGLNNPSAFGVSLVVHELRAQGKKADILSFGAGESSSRFSVFRFRYRTVAGILRTVIDSLLKSGGALMDRFYEAFGAALPINKYLRTNHPRSGSLSDWKSIPKIEQHFEHEHLRYRLFSNENETIVDFGEQKATADALVTVWRDEFHLVPPTERRSNVAGHTAATKKQAPTHDTASAKGPLPLSSTVAAPLFLWRWALSLVPAIAVLLFVSVLCFGCKMFVDKGRLSTANAQLETARDELAVSNSALKIANAQVNTERNVVQTGFRLFRNIMLRLISVAELHNQPGPQPLPEMILSRVQKKIGELEKDPKRQDELALLYEELGTFAEIVVGRESATAFYTEAFRIYERLVRANNDRPEYRGKLAHARTKLAIVLHDLGQSQEAEQHYDAAQAALDELVKEWPEDLVYQANLGEDYHNLAILCARKNRHQEALRYHKQALKIRESLFEADPRSEYENDLARSYGYMGDVYLQRREWRDAQRVYDEAERIRRKLHRADPGDSEAQFQLARSYWNTANLNHATMDWKEAVEAYKKAKEIQEELVGNYPLTPYRSDLGGVCNLLGKVHVDLGELAEARRLLIRAHSIFERLRSQDPNNISYLRSLAWSYVYLGKIEIQTDPANAKVLLDKAREILDGEKLRSQLGKNPEYLYTLAVVYALSGKEYAAKAVEALEKAAETGYLTIKHLENDTSFRSLDSHGGYKTLKTELEKRTPGAQ